MLLIGLGIFYVAVIVGVYALQKYIIFQSDQLESDYEFVFEKSFKEFFIKTIDGEQINMLLFKTEIPRKGLVIYFHGNADNLQRWGRYQKDFTTRGYDILLLDYRGYGKSTGKSNEQKFYEDAKLIYDWATQRYSKDKIIIYGRSLGTGVASNLATQVDAQKVILETPFNNINDLFQIKSSIFYLPFRLKYNFPNDVHLKKIQEPVFIFAGTEDWVVPPRSTKKLKPFLKSSDRYIEIEGGGHKNLNEFEKYHRVLDEILVGSFQSQ